MPEITPLLANTMISDNFEIFHVEDVVQQEKTLYHYHDFYEIHVTLNGVGAFYLDGKQYEVAPGTILLIHYHDLHRIIAQSSNQFERVYMFLTPQFLQSRSTKHTNLERCFMPIGNMRSKVLKADPAELVKLLAALMVPANIQDYGKDLEYEQELIHLLLYLNRLVLSEEFEAQPQSTVDDELIEGLIDYVSNHLSEDLSLDMVAQEFYLSKYYIARKFKQHTHLTFHTYVLKKRLLYAKQLLKKYQNSTEIFRQCGFKSYPHFLKCFKKEFHMTPKEFIKRDKENEAIFFDHHK